MATAVLYPSEFDTSRLRLGTRRSFGKGDDDWSMDLYYDDLPLQLETPWMSNVFGLSKYEQPNGRVAYSMSFELSLDSEVADFHRFLCDFEDWFQVQLKEMGVKLPYYSSIRPAKNPKYNPTLRLKLKTRHDNFDCQMWENKSSVARWPIGEERVRHGEKCRLIIQLMPIWCAGGRVGTSWKLVGLQKQAESQFRTAETPSFSQKFNRDSFVPTAVFRDLIPTPISRDLPIKPPPLERVGEPPVCIRPPNNFRFDIGEETIQSIQSMDLDT